MKKSAALVIALIWMLCLAVPSFADGVPTFTYQLLLTDQDGRTVTDPRSLSAGSVLNIELELMRTDIADTTYDYFGIEFRLLTLGLRYNNDGATLRADTEVREVHYMDGDSVGFAWYDLEQVGGSVGNPVLTGRWSYTVTDPSIVNIRVPVALVYVTGHTEDFVPVGRARLTLDPNGGVIVGTDVSGEYDSGTVVTLPDAEFGDYVFEGWSDGATLYPAGAEFTVTGIVTLTAQWAELERNRHLTLDPNGGEIDGIDVTGYYAEGEVVTLPNAVRDGYEFQGWNDGVGDYGANSDYTVYNTVILVAQWEPGAPAEEEDLRDNMMPFAAWFHNPDGTLNTGRVAGVGIAGLGLLLLLLLLLWKLRWVLYSLKTGDVALSYKEKEHDYQVEVVLYDEDEDGRAAEYHLNKSGMVEKKHRLRFIHGQEELYPIVEVDAGKYKGKLIVTDPEGNVTEERCRIKVLDREIRERENR